MDRDKSEACCTNHNRTILYGSVAPRPAPHPIIFLFIFTFSLLIVNSKLKRIRIIIKAHQPFKAQTFVLFFLSLSQTMKKLYRKGTVHPSPSSSPPPPTISDHLSFLPATILTLTLSLSPEDREVLAYLLSCSSSNNHNNNNFSKNHNHHRRNPKVVVDGDHAPLFNCSCFRCYMSYWVRWNSSPNHQLIHEIIDAFEDSLTHTTKPSRKDKRNKRGSKTKPSELTRSEFHSSPSEALPEGSSNGGGDGSEVEVGEGGDGGGDEEKGSVRRFVSFIGERIWGAWGP